MGTPSAGGEDHCNGGAMSRVLIVHTGGTIGMTRTERGYEPDGAFFRSALFHMDSLKADDMPQWDLVETEPLLDSSRMSVKEWNKIGKIIADSYEKYDGFVVLHGTDTMAYTASAMSFMFRGLNKPVILTGSQIPLCETRSDGRDNLITSLVIAGSGKVREVCVYFGGLLLRGNRTTKYSADGMQAFVSPNYPALATAGIEIQYNEPAIEEGKEERFSFTPMDEVAIGVLKVFPGINFSLFRPMLAGVLKGVVIETFGSGNTPDDSGALEAMAEESRGTVIVVCSQCTQATVNMSAYEAGAPLRKIGAVSGKDMTTEAAVAKLYYLFSICSDIGKIKEQIEKDLAGELTE